MAIVNWVMDKFVKVGRETHVANAYTENIYVRVTADIRYLETDSDVSIANFKINSGKNIWDKCDKKKRRRRKMMKKSASYKGRSMPNQGHIYE